MHANRPHAFPQPKRGWSWIHPVVIAAVVVIGYANTLDVPFVFDDARNIVDNELVHDPWSLFDWQRTSQHVQGHQLGLTQRRWVGVLSFALNYRVHGADVRGYHVVNALIHATNAWLVYLLTLRLTRAPVLRQTLAGGAAASLLAGLLFAAHPLCTQAVTYVVQRFTSLSALFALASIVAWFDARQARTTRARLSWLGASLLACLLAMKTKEPAFTLPLVIVALDLLLFPGPLAARVRWLLPHLALLPVVPASLQGGSGDLLDAARVAPAEVTPWIYLLTESRVVMDYWRLLVLPVGQVLDPHVELATGFFDGSVLASLAGHAAVVGLATWCGLRSRSARLAVLRVVPLGVAWFYLGLAVESSLFPIVDPKFEHRTYFPMVGPVAAASILAAHRLAGASRSARALVWVVLPAVLLACTVARNRVWQSSATLWADNVDKAPLQSRGHYNLAIELQRSGDLDGAAQHFERAIELGSGEARAHHNLGVIYQGRGWTDAARQQYQEALSLDPTLGGSWVQIGTLEFSAGRFAEAERAYRRASQVDPELAEAYLDLGMAVRAQGRPDEAAALYLHALELDPELVAAWDSLAKLRATQGHTVEAIEAWRRVLDLDAGQADAARYLRAACGSLGEPGPAACR